MANHLNPAGRDDATGDVDITGAALNGHCIVVVKHDSIYCRYIKKRLSAHIKQIAFKTKHAFPSRKGLILRVC